MQTVNYTKYHKVGSKIQRKSDHGIVRKCKEYLFCRSGGYSTEESPWQQQNLLIICSPLTLQTPDIHSHSGSVYHHRMDELHARNTRWRNVEIPLERKRKIIGLVLIIWFFVLWFLTLSMRVLDDILLDWQIDGRTDQPYSPLSDSGSMFLISCQLLPQLWDNYVYQGYLSFPELQKE